MALTFKSKRETIELESMHNEFHVLYRYTLKNGALEGNIEAHVDLNGVQKGDKYTSDGKYFWGNIYEDINDDFGDLNELIKQEMVQIYNDPTSFIPV